jgi:hypothetical protein
MDWFRFVVDIQRVKSVVRVRLHHRARKLFGRELGELKPIDLQKVLDKGVQAQLGVVPCVSQSLLIF